MLSSLLDDGDDETEILVVDTEPRVEEVKTADHVEQDATTRKEPDSSTSQTEDESQVKRPMNAYMCWSVEQRKQLKQLKEQNLSFPLATQEVSRHLGELWRSMSTDEKQPYYDEAKRLRAVHKAMYPDYQYRSRQKRKRKVNSEKMKCPVQNKVLQTPTNSQLSHEVSDPSATRPVVFTDPCISLQETSTSSTTNLATMGQPCPWQSSYPLASSGYTWNSPYIFGFSKNYSLPTNMCHSCDAVSTMNVNMCVPSTLPSIFSPAQTTRYCPSDARFMDQLGYDAFQSPHDLTRIFPPSQMGAFYPSWWQYATDAGMNQGAEAISSMHW